MAQEPILKIDGTEVPNILSVEYSLRAEADRDGRPTRKMFFDGIVVRRIMDDKTILCDWAKSPKEENRKGGEVQFFSDTGTAMKTLEFKGAYLRDYRVDFDERGDHVVEVAHVQPEVILVGGVEVNFNWPDK